MRRIDRWLLAHGRTLDRAAWTLTFLAIAYVAGSVGIALLR